MDILAKTAADPSLFGSTIAVIDDAFGSFGVTFSVSPAPVSQVRVLLNKKTERGGNSAAGMYSRRLLRMFINFYGNRLACCFNVDMSLISFCHLSSQSLSVQGKSRR